MSDIVIVSGATVIASPRPNPSAESMVRDGVRYRGNVELGRDVSLAELEGIYDAVVLAVHGDIAARLLTRVEQAILR